MFSTLANIFGSPNIPVRVANDDTAFDTKEYPNISFIAKGNVQGSVKIVHDDTVDSGMVSTRLWVQQVKDADKIRITPSFDNKTCSVVMETPSGFGQPTVYHETMVMIPTATSSVEDVHLEAPNSTLFGDFLQNLKFRTLRGRFSNGTVDLKPLHATDEIDITTSNATITGHFESSKINLQTANGQISVIIKTLVSSDQKNVTPVQLRTSNAQIDVHLDASQAVRGLQLLAHSTNGKVTTGILLAQGATNPSLLDIGSTNAKLDINVDAAKLGNSLEIRSKTINGSITQSVMVPYQQVFQTSAISSNAPVNINLTNEFEGGFDLSTSNSSANVEGTGIHYSNEKKNAKTGTRGRGDLGFVTAKSSNGAINLRFYPGTQSSTSQ
ncbi:hypothetical protein BGW42_000196 [Actinomortierella wolfii]|nr:hypothetical protein BGW42_000196 [Actinomortierella wolfii]